MSKVLQAAEAFSVGSSSGGTPCKGDFKITDEDSYELVKKCSSISGSLHISTQTLEDIHLPLLESVGASLSCDAEFKKTNGEFKKTNGELGQLSLPNLTTIGEYFSLQNNFALEVLDFSNLVSIGDSLSVDNPRESEIYSNRNLETIIFPKLTRVPRLNISGHESSQNGKQKLKIFKLKTLSFPALRSTDYFRVGWNDTLEKLSCPNMQIAGDVEVCDNDELKTMDFTHLESVKGSLTVTSAKRLQTMAFPKLVSIENDFEISLNIDLQNISMPELTTIGNTFRNTRKGTGEVSILTFEKLSSIGGAFYFDENGGLEAVNLPALDTVRRFVLRRHSSLCTLQCEKLTSVDTKLGNAEIGIEIVDNKNLETVYFPMLNSVGKELNVNNNKSLQRVSFPSLRKEKKFKIHLTAHPNRVRFAMDLRAMRTALGASVVDGQGIYVRSAKKTAPRSFGKVDKSVVQHIEGFLDEDINI